MIFLLQSANGQQEQIEFAWIGEFNPRLNYKFSSKINFEEAENIIDSIVKTVNQGYALGLRNGSELLLNPNSDCVEVEWAIGDALMIASDYRFSIHSQ